MLYGKEKILEVGDIIPSESLEEMNYNQENEKCSNLNQDACKDSFSFIPLSSWMGEGYVSHSIIKLKPVQIEIETQKTSCLGRICYNEPMLI